MTAEWKPNHDHIKHFFIKNRGNVAATAKNLEIGRETLHRYIAKHKDLQEALELAREVQAVDELDLAVSLNFLFMQDYKNNPNLASKHAIFTLEKKGHARGYIKDSSELSQNKELENKFDDSMAHVLSLLSPDRKMDDNNISSET